MDQDTAPCASRQLQLLETGVASFADDDVVMHGNAERAGDLDDRPGHLDVGARRRRVARRVIVHEATAPRNKLI
jgi:hypothetical protein